MAADNKMWEGHRMILPELRDQLSRPPKAPFPRPLWDEQKLESLERILHHAIVSKTWLELTLWLKDGPLLHKIQPIKRAGPALQCLTKSGETLTIPLADILDLETTQDL